eukprot:5315618-Pyramimonas_sp.AAC.1
MVLAKQLHCRFDIETTNGYPVECPDARHALLDMLSSFTTSASRLPKPIYVSSQSSGDDVYMGVDRHRRYGTIKSHRLAPSAYATTVLYTRPQFGLTLLASCQTDRAALEHQYNHPSAPLHPEVGALSKLARRNKLARLLPTRG